MTFDNVAKKRAKFNLTNIVADLYIKTKKEV